MDETPGPIGRKDGFIRLWQRQLLVMLGLWLTAPHATAAELEVWLRAFLPDPDSAGDATPVFVANPSDPYSSMVKLVLAGSAIGDCFATDHRGFSSTDGTTARTETRFRIVLGAEGRAGIVPRTGLTTAGVVRRLNCESGELIAQRPGRISRDHIGHPAVADGKVQVTGQAQGANTLVLQGLGPAIDYSYSVLWSPLHGSVTLDVTHGVFPAFEAYVRHSGGAWVRVMHHLPEGSPLRLAGDAIGINTRRQVRTVTIPD